MAAAAPPTPINPHSFAAALASLESKGYLSPFGDEDEDEVPSATQPVASYRASRRPDSLSSAGTSSSQDSFYTLHDEPWSEAGDEHYEIAREDFYGGRSRTSSYGDDEGLVTPRAPVNRSRTSSVQAGQFATPVAAAHVPMEPGSGQQAAASALHAPFHAAAASDSTAVSRTVPVDARTAHAAVERPMSISAANDDSSRPVSVTSLASANDGITEAELRALENQVNPKPQPRSKNLARIFGQDPTHAYSPPLSHGPGPVPAARAPRSGATQGFPALDAQPEPTRRQRPAALNLSRPFRNPHAPPAPSPGSARFRLGDDYLVPEAAPLSHVGELRRKLAWRPTTADDAQREADRRDFARLVLGADEALATKVFSARDEGEDVEWHAAVADSPGSERPSMEQPEAFPDVQPAADPHGMRPIRAIHEDAHWPVRSDESMRRRPTWRSTAATKTEEAADAQALLDLMLEAPFAQQRGATYTAVDAREPSWSHPSYSSTYESGPSRECPPSGPPTIPPRLASAAHSRQTSREVAGAPVIAKVPAASHAHSRIATTPTASRPGTANATTPTASRPGTATTAAGADHADFWTFSGTSPAAIATGSGSAARPVKRLTAYHDEPSPYQHRSVRADDGALTPASSTLSLSSSSSDGTASDAGSPPLHRPDSPASEASHDDTISSAAASPPPSPKPHLASPLHPHPRHPTSTHRSSTSISSFATSASASTISTHDLSHRPVPYALSYPALGATARSSPSSSARSPSLDSTAPPPISLVRGERTSPSDASRPGTRPRRALGLRRSLFRKSTPRLASSPITETRTISTSSGSSQQSLGTTSTASAVSKAEQELLRQSISYEETAAGTTPFSSQGVANCFPQDQRKQGEKPKKRKKQAPLGLDLLAEWEVSEAVARQSGGPARSAPVDVLAGRGYGGPGSAVDVPADRGYGGPGSAPVDAPADRGYGGPGSAPVDARVDRGYGGPSSGPGSATSGGPGGLPAAAPEWNLERSLGLQAARQAEDSGRGADWGVDWEGELERWYGTTDGGTRLSVLVEEG